MSKTRRTAHWQSRRRALLVVAVLSIAGAVGLALEPSSQSKRRRQVAPVPARSAANLPAPAKGFAIPAPRQLGGADNVTRWAPVVQATVARRTPSFDSPVVTRVGRLTPEGTANLVDADGETTRDGSTWVRVRPAVLPDGLTGWIPRRALGGWSFVNTRAVIDRATLTFTLYRNGSVVFRAPVGIGKATTPTPAGRFYVRDRLTAYASAEYGPVAFGTSARSPYETDWPAGGFIGIHGTDQPELIPGRISHGCVRLRNAAILTLAKLMPVGTPVTIT